MKEYGVCYARHHTETDQALARSRERVYQTTGVVHDPTMQANWDIKYLVFYDGVYRVTERCL